jgi:hypothetical protein
MPTAQCAGAGTVTSMVPARSPAPDPDEAFGVRYTRPAPPDSGHDKWCRWINEIDTEVTTLFLARTTWQTVMGIVSDHPSMPPSHFFDFVTGGYVAMQTMAVRRQCEVSDRVVSLARLLAEIQAHPEIVSRERYVGCYPRGTQWIGHREFDDFAAETGAHVSGEVVATDLVRLRELAEPVKQYVYRRLAHFDKAPPDVIPVFDDLDIAIDAIGDAFRKYLRLLTGADRTPIAPVANYDWLAPFCIPWLERPTKSERLTFSKDEVAVCSVGPVGPPAAVAVPAVPLPPLPCAACCEYTKREPEAEAG